MSHHHPTPTDLAIITLFTIALLIGLAMVAPSARGHTDLEAELWRSQWLEEVTKAGGLTPELVEAHIAFTVAHQPPPEPSARPARAYRAPAPPPGPPPASAEQWRPLVSAYFGPNTDAALAVLYCESRGNPNATHPSSGAAGLFQAMPQWFTGSGWTAPSPYGAFDPYNPEANVAFAAWLSGGGSSWSHWVCKP